MSVSAFGEDEGAASAVNGGELVLSDAFGTALEPAPITPTGESQPWQLLSGTITATHATSQLINASTIAVGPGLATGEFRHSQFMQVT